MFTLDAKNIRTLLAGEQISEKHLKYVDQLVVQNTHRNSSEKNHSTFIYQTIKIFAFSTTNIPYVV